jgi:transposase-like protein
MPPALVKGTGPGLPHNSTVKFIEDQFVDAQQEIEKLRKQNHDLENENRSLLHKLANVRKALG